MPKFSQYNTYIFMSDYAAIYNVFSGGLYFAPKAIIKQLMVLSKTSNKIPQLINGNLLELKRNGIVINDDRDEFEEYKYKRNHIKFANNIASFLILTSRVCNFKCPYCYQIASGLQSGLMEEKVCNRVIDFMKKMICVNESRKITIGISGGEPLLNPIISGRIMSQMFKYAREKEISIQYSLTTNGYYIDDLKNKPVIRLSSAVNIVLDGPEEKHNLTRSTQLGQPSYRKIIKGIRQLIELKKILGIRIHYNNLDVEDLRRILDDLLDAGVTKSSKINIYLKNIEPLPATTEQAFCSTVDLEGHQKFMRHVRYLSDGIRSHSLYHLFNWGQTTPNQPIPLVYACDFSRQTSFCINFDGTLMKCCDTPGELTTIGTIAEDGNVEWTEAYSHTLILEPWDRRICQECLYLPICGGACVIRSDPTRENNCKNRIEIFGDMVKDYVASQFQRKIPRVS